MSETRSGRRRMLAALAVAMAWRPARALAQQPRKARRIGLMMAGSSDHPELILEFMPAFRALGYREDEIELQALFAEGRRERLDVIAAELVVLKPDVIFAGGTAGTLAARRATSTIPIVFAGVPDPVGAGLVESLARPGGNVTGVSSYGVEAASKPVELLRQVVPRLRRIGILGSGNPGMAPLLKATQAAARSLGVQSRLERAETLVQIEAAFASFRKSGMDALVIVSDTPTHLDRARVAELAAALRLPAVYSSAAHVEAGGLMSHGPKLSALIPQAVGYIDRILKGARPGDLAVQGPRDFELALNRDAARELGITFPRELVQRANSVIGRE